MKLLDTLIIMARIILLIQYRWTSISNLNTKESGIHVRIVNSKQQNAGYINEHILTKHMGKVYTYY